MGWLLTKERYLCAFSRSDEEEGEEFEEEWGGGGGERLFVGGHCRVGNINSFPLS